MNFIESIVAGVIVVVFGGLLKWLNNKVECKLDREVYDVSHSVVVDELREGKVRFEKLDAKLEEQTKCLHSLDTTTQLIQQTLNGIVAKNGGSQGGST